MESILNELSLQGLANNVEEVRQQITQLLNLFRELKKYGFTKIKFADKNFYEQELIEGYTFNNWLNDPTVSKIQQEVFRSSAITPYFEGLSEAAQEEYYSYDKYILHAPNTDFHETEGEGLVNAYLANVLAISFPSHTLWESCTISLFRYEEEEGEECQVIHASKVACLDNNFHEWFKKRNRPPLNSHSEVDLWFPPTQFILSDRAKDELILYYQNNEHRIIVDIEGLLDEIQVNPMVGKGKPETLKDDFKGWMSRKLTKGDRLVYKKEESLIHVYSCRRHYNDK